MRDGGLATDVASAERSMAFSNVGMSGAKETTDVV